MPIPELPAEIWFRIVQFLHPHELRNLISINRLFFELGMNERYREVKLESFHYEVIQELLHLRNPTVGKRVQSLNLGPFFINSIVLAYGDSHSFAQSSKLYMVWEAFHRIKGKLGKLLLLRVPSNYNIQTRHGAAQLALDTIESLSNVTDFSFAWKIHHRSRPAIPRKLIYSCFRSQLRSLSIDIILSNYDVLMLSDFTFDNLEHLALKLHMNMSDSRDPIKVAHPFITKVSHTLKSFSFFYLGDNLDTGFHDLPYMPLLESVTIHTSHHPIQSGLHKMLVRQASNIKYLSLWSNFYSHHPNPTLDWIPHTLSGIGMPKLESLSLSSSYYPLDLTATVEAVKNLFPTLIDLTWLQRFFSYSEVTLLTSSFSTRPVHSRLTSLRLNVFSLTPQLFDLLAENLPYLWDLSLNFKVVLRHEGDLPRFACANHWLGQAAAQVDAFHDEMQTRKYDEWQLHYLYIYQSFRLKTTQYGDPAAFIKSCIPSVKCGGTSVCFACTPKLLRKQPHSLDDWYTAYDIGV